MLQLVGSNAIYCMQQHLWLEGAYGTAWKLPEWGSSVVVNLHGWLFEHFRAHVLWVSGCCTVALYYYGPRLPQVAAASLAGQ